MKYFMILMLLLFASPAINSNTIWSTSQNIGKQTDYSIYINSKFKLKPQIVTGTDFEESITYLGELKLGKGQVFYILTSFKKIQAAIVNHGFASIYILDINKKLAREYRLNSDEELPFRVKNNSLYFHYLEANTSTLKTFINIIGPGLPEMMCVGPVGGCY
jgi:hypothetical protein